MFCIHLNSFEMCTYAFSYEFRKICFSVCCYLKDATQEVDIEF